MGGGLMAAFDRADQDDEARVVIVTGAGRAFCAGADLKKGGETFDWRARGGADADSAPADDAGDGPISAEQPEESET